MSSELENKVNDFSTTHKEGYTNSGIKRFLKNYPGVKFKSFSKAMGVVTCLMVDKEFVYYHSDVYYALRKCLTGIKQNSMEWD